MSRRFTGKQTEVTIREKRPNGDVYIYRRITAYSQETKKMHFVSQKLLGKIPAGTTEMVPTRPRKAPNTRPHPQAAPVLDSRKHVGCTQILDWVGKTSGIDESLDIAFFLGGDAAKIKSIARYMVVSEGKPLPYIESWQIMHNLPYTEQISEKVYLDLFKSISQNEDSIQRYFLCQSLRAKDNNIIAFDSTIISPYSKYQKEYREDAVDTIKILTLYSVAEKQLIAFSKQSGNLPDVITVRNAINKIQCLDVNTPLIITDNGYFSDKNLSLFFLNGMNFLMLASKDAKWIREEIDKNRENIEKRINICPFDVSIKGCISTVMYKIKKEYSTINTNKEDKYFTKKLYVYTYYNKSLAVEVENDFDKKIVRILSNIKSGIKEFSIEDLNFIKEYLIKDSTSNNLYIINEEKIKEELKYVGFFSFVSNKKLDVFEAFKYYFLREKIEEQFSLHKGYMDCKCPYIWYEESIKGRLFVQFISISYNLFLYNKIKEIKKKLSEDITNFKIKFKEAKAIDNPKEALKKLDQSGLTKKQDTANRKLLNWLENRSLLQILDWFDCVEEASVQSKVGEKRWSTEAKEQDRMFLKLLMGKDYPNLSDEDSPASLPEDVAP